MGVPGLENTSHELLTSLERCLGDYYVSVFREPLQNLKPFKVVERPFSLVLFLQARSPSGVRRFVAKKVVHHPSNVSVTREKNQAVIEYELLTKLHAVYRQVPSCSVPQPILVVPEEEMYVMSFVEGELLADRLRYSRLFSSARGFEELCQSYFDVGTWLRYFQEATGVRQSTPGSFESVLNRCQERLQFLEQSAQGRIPTRFCTAIWNWLAEKVRGLNANPVEVAGRHGDFGPWNVIAGAGGITVIDFLGYREEPVYVDVAHWLMTISDEKLGFLSSARKVCALRRQFLLGYARDIDFSSPAFMICEAVQRIISMLGCVEHPTKRLHHRIEAQRRFKRHVRWFELRMEGSACPPKVEQRQSLQPGSSSQGAVRGKSR